MNVLDFKKRSVGHLPAPRADAELVEKLATSEERAAVVRYLRKCADCYDNIKRVTLLEAAFDIEHGGHVK